MLVTLCGLKRSGKGTVDKMLTEKLNCLSYALAGPIKTSLSLALDNVLPDQFVIDDVEGLSGYDRESDMGINDNIANHIMREFWCNVYMYTDHDFTEVYKRVDEYLKNNPNKPWSIRRFMQVLGTDIGVAMDKMIWVNIFDRLFVYLKEIMPWEPGTYPIIMSDCRQQHEIEYSRANNAFVIHIKRDTGNADTHSTEAGIEPIEGEYILDNNGSLKDLEHQVNKLAEIISELAEKRKICSS